MSQYDGLLELIPVGEIAQQLGISPEVAQSAVAQVIPAIIGGLSVNAQDASGASSLENALGSHADKVAASAPSLSAIDTADGAKIVSKVFGAKTPEVAAAVADTGAGGVTKDIIAKLLPIVAPIVLAWLANQFLGTKQAPAAPTPAAPASSGGIGDLLGGLLGSQQGQDILGGVLGGLLGGKK